MARAASPRRPAKFPLQAFGADQPVAQLVAFMVDDHRPDGRAVPGAASRTVGVTGVGDERHLQRVGLGNQVEQLTVIDRARRRVSTEIPTAEATAVSRRSIRARFVIPDQPGGFRCRRVASSAVAAGSAAARPILPPDHRRSPWRRRSHRWRHRTPSSGRHGRAPAPCATGSGIPSVLPSGNLSISLDFTAVGSSGFPTISRALARLRTGGAGR